MAKVYLDSNDTFTISNNGTTVFGQTGTEVVTIASGVTGVVLDAGVERVVLSGASSAYTFLQAGNTVKVYSAGVLVFSTPVQDDATGTQLTFTNGTANVVLTAGVLTLGGATISGTAAAAVTPTTIDATVVAPTPTPVVTSPTFSVTAGAAAFEGTNATFTVTLSTAQAAATTVAYALTGAGTAVLGTDTTTVANGTLTFAAGEVTKTITVPVTLDTVVETGEGVKLTLSSPSTGTVLATVADATVNFTDAPVPTYAVTSNGATKNAEGSTVTFSITPSSPVLADTTMTYTVNGDTLSGVATAATGADFSQASGTVTFVKGQTTASTVIIDLKSGDGAESLEGYKFVVLDGNLAAVGSVLGQVIDADSAGGGTGSTFTLTTAADTLTGTSANDTFIALVDFQTTANSTLSASDTVNGSTGTGDVLSITTQGTSNVTDAFNSALVSNIETINLRAVSTGGTTTLVASSASGLTLLNNNLSSDGVVITGLASTTALKITGNTTVTNGATTATYATSATAGAVTLDGGLTAGAVAVNGSGFTSFTINSTGATNTIGALSSSGTSIAATTINATTAMLTTGLTVGTVAAGGQTLTISGAAGDRAATSTAAARSAVTLGALDADFVSITASGLSAGGVSATLSATTAATFTGGVGSDRITTSTSGQTGSIDAGTGTDTLTLAVSGHIDTTAEGAIYKGFEVLAVADNVSIDLDLLTGSTIVAIAVADAASATSITDLSATQAAAVTVAAADGALTLGVKDATTTGTLNTLNLTVSDGNTTGSEALWTTGDVTVAGVETINITATDDVTWATMANVTGLTSLVVSGAADVSITTLVHVVSANESVNFSGLTAASTFNFAGATTNALAFTGGSGIDTVTTSVIGGNVVTTGAGADVITLTQTTSGSSGVTVTAGAGGDSIVATSQGNAAYEAIKLKFAAGDSVSDSSVTGTGFLAAKMDAVTAVDFAATAAAADGHVITFDTVESATAVTFASTAVTFGTTAVTNAYDFYVYNTGAGGITYVYQDTDGDKLIETGEFGIQLTGIAATATITGEFAVTTGNLVLTTIA